MSLHDTPFDQEAVPRAWPHRHLLDLERLTPEEIRLLLDTASRFKEATDGCRKKIAVLSGSTIVNLFLKTLPVPARASRLAARRLGADVIDFSASGSSLSKGESFIDTAKNLEAMGINAVVVRHGTPGTPHLLAQRLGVGVINAGDGPHEHPTQGLLDIFSIREPPWGFSRRDRWPRWRHCPQSHGEVQSLGSHQTRCQSDSLRSAHACFAAMARARRGSLARSRCDCAPLRRAQLVAHSV